MAIYDEYYSLIASTKSIGAFKSEREIQYHFVNLSLGQFCPVTVIYPDHSNNGEYRRIDTLRAHDFYVCECQEKENFRTADCEELCVNIAHCLNKINAGESNECLNGYLNDKFVFHSTEHSINYLQFVCPISNLIKFAFPIRYENQEICTVFVGQYSIVTPIKTSRSLFTKTKSTTCTKKCFPVDKQFESEGALVEYINSVIVPEISNLIHVINENIQSDIEQRLQQGLQKAEQNLSRAMYDVLSYNCASSMEDYGTNVLNLFWNAVRAAYSDLFTSISACKVILFVNDDFSDQNSFKHRINGTVLFSTKQEDDHRELESIILNYANISELCTEKNKRILTSATLTPEELISCFVATTSSALNRCEFVYSNKGIHSPYALLINFKIPQVRQKTIINCAIKIADNINYELASIFSKLSEHATKSILRIYRHEIVHQILALRTSLGALNSGNEHIPTEKLTNIFRDCSDCLYELSFMTENIKLFTGWSAQMPFGVEETQATKEVDVFKDVINKHIVMHREVRKNKNLWFEVLGKAENVHTISCKPLLLDLLLFNIISNAVKYSYEGTNIWFKYSVDEEQHNVKKLTISDYGPSIAEDESIYKLYYRGPELANVETGSGIGLFLAKRLATIMGIKICHNCKKVSNYNVPLMEYYLETVTEQDLIESCELPHRNTIIKELARLKTKKLYTQVANLNMDEPRKISKAQILADITLPTFEVSFTLEL